MTKEGKLFYEWACKYLFGVYGDERKGRTLKSIEKCLNCEHFKYVPEEWHHHKAKCMYHSDKGRIIFQDITKESPNVGRPRSCPLLTPEDIKEIDILKLKNRILKLDAKIAKDQEKLKRYKEQLKEMEG